MLLLELIGIPMYLCNGADILLLRPLLDATDLTVGSAMVFSLTSSAVCISSIAMLSGYLGKKLTAVLVVTLVLITYCIGLCISLLPVF